MGSEAGSVWGLEILHRATTVDSLLAPALSILAGDRECALRLFPFEKPCRDKTNTIIRLTLSAYCAILSDIGAYMSDGPHKSLPMTRKWKKVAELADNSAFDIKDVAIATDCAIENDWKHEGCAGLIEKMKVLMDTPTLFPNGQFESLRNMVVGKPLGGFILDSLSFAIDSGLSGLEALSKAVSMAVVDRSERAIRQVQEHYIRKSNFHRSYKVTSRISNGIRELGLEKLASRLLNPSSSRPQPRMKRTGLDEGIRL